MSKIKIYLLYASLFFVYSQGFWERMFGLGAYRIVEFFIVLFIIYPVKNIVCKSPGYRLFLVFIIVGFLISIANGSGTTNWLLYIRFILYFFLIYHQLWNNPIHIKQWLKIFRFIVFLIILQGIGAFTNIFIFGERVEGYVGLMSSTGGTTATSFPLLIISISIIIWMFLKRKVFKLNLILIACIVSSFLVAYSSGKRAIYFLVPIFILIITIISFYKLRFRAKFYKKLLLMIVLVISSLPVFLIGIMNSKGLNYGLSGNDDSLGVIKNAIDFAIFYEGDETEDGATIGRSNTTKLIVLNSLTDNNQLLIGNGFRSLKQDEGTKADLGIVYGIVGFTRDIVSAGSIFMLITVLIFLKILLTNSSIYVSRFTAAFKIVILLVFMVIHFGYSVDFTVSLKINFLIAIFCVFLYSPKQSKASIQIVNRYLY